MPDKDVHDAFDAVVAGADYPMWVLTTAVEDHRAGCLIGFCTQIGIHPRRFLVGVSKNNHTFRVVSRAAHLALHLLPAHDIDSARLFGSETGDDIDKFAHCESFDGPYGLPILTAAVGWFAAAIIERHDFGDHTGLLLEPVAASAPPDSAAVLRYRDVADLPAGHEA
ncbi:flavin reductase family protein [Nocardia brevicatena]|uniref:flavin reductase family protein n=1 Tax=Nocardia brevicatena TaxID=37327 RepID=UPI0002E90A8A|nr:flavin reductase family protein [Nocardia brevicatena]